ncbi:MAG: extracellular solute-binding protein [Clostridiales bacterium]|nr:extracellular solute-binding protein [Clostridiales bacterium]
MIAADGVAAFEGVYQMGVHLKKLFFTAGLFVAAIFLSSCAGTAEPEQPEKLRLEYWHYDSPAGGDQLNHLVRQFNDSQDQIEIVSKYIPSVEFKKKLLLAIADGTQPDLALIERQAVPHFDKLDVLCDIGPYVEEDKYLDLVLDECTNSRGQMIALPLGFCTCNLYYNVELLEQAGVEPPTCQAELLSVANRVKNNEVYGFGFPGAEDIECLFVLTPFIWAEGGDVRKPDSENCEKVLELLRELSASGAMDRNVVTSTVQDIIRQFASGRLAMMLGPSGREEQILAQNPDASFGVVPVPTGETLITTFSGEAIAVLKDEHREAAGEFIRFMAEPEHMTGYLDSMGYLAPQKELLEWQLEEYPKYQVYYDYLLESDARPFEISWPDESVRMADRIRAVIIGEDDGKTEAAE